MGRLSFTRMNRWEDAEEEADAWAPRRERNLSPSLHGVAFFLYAPHTPFYMGNQRPCLYIDVIGPNRAARVYRRGVGLFFL